MLSQNQLINKILDTKDASIIVANDLEPKYFFNYKAEFSFILNHYNTYNSIPDKVTFLNTFPNFELQEVNEPNSYLLAQLFDDYNNSQLVIGFNQVKKKFEAGHEKEAMEIYKEQIANGFHEGGSFQPISLIKDTSRYDRYLDRSNNKSEYYISTGFPEIDKITGGIDCKNENLVIAARTGQGKTMCMVKLACAAYLQGRRVGIFEGEMTEDKLGYRIDACLGQLKNSALNRGELWAQKEYKNYIDNLALSSNKGDISILTPNNAGGPVTVRMLEAYIQRDKLNYLCVDQYSLLEDTSLGKTYFERVGNLAKEIKRLQTKYQIPIVAVAQMNRTKNEDGSQDTTQIGLSDMIPQYATTLLMLDRDKNDRTKLDINIVKARDGGDGTKITYKVDWDTYTFTYIPAENDKVSSEEDMNNLKDSYSTEVFPFEDALNEDSPF